MRRVVVIVVEVVDRPPNRVVGGGTCLAIQSLRLQALPPNRAFANFLSREAIPVYLQLERSLPTHDVVDLWICKEV